MYNMSMLRHRFSNEWCVGGGGGGAPEPPPLLFCKSVYINTFFAIEKFAPNFVSFIQLSSVSIS